MDMFETVGTMVADIGHMDGFGWSAMILVWITLIAAIGAVIWVVTRDTTATRSNPTASALAILAERYARGEIDDEEYRRRADQLRSRA